MKVAICWSNISGYSAACWRELSCRSGLTLKVWAFEPAAKGSEAPFEAEKTLAGFETTLLDQSTIQNSNSLVSELKAFSPDVLLVPGWICPAYVGAVLHHDFSNCKKIMGIDLPWDGRVRQRIGTVVKRRYVQQFDTVWVAGERAYQYARRLIGDDRRIRRGLYAYDAACFDPVALSRIRKPATWPQRFLFVGRYVETKGVDVLLQAYSLYREAVADPWHLDCCGAGPLAHMLESRAGVTDYGFTQPQDLPARFASAGAFVLASRYEPWGVVIAEAMGSGMPVIASNACGAGVELIADRYNGCVFPTDRIEQLAQAMVLVSSSPGLAAIWGKRAQVASQGYTAKVWADRFEAIMAKESVTKLRH